MENLEKDFLGWIGRKVKHEKNSESSEIGAKFCDECWSVGESSLRNLLKKCQRTFESEQLVKLENNLAKKFEVFNENVGKIFYVESFSTSKRETIMRGSRKGIKLPLKRWIPSGDIIHLHAIIYSVNKTRSEWIRCANQPERENSYETWIEVKESKETGAGWMYRLWRKDVHTMLQAWVERKTEFAFLIVLKSWPKKSWSIFIESLVQL